MPADSHSARLPLRRRARRARPLRSAALLGALALSIVPAIAPRVAHAVGTPFTQNGVALANLATEVTYTVDFSTLPLRPKLIVEAVPDASHSNMELRLEITNCNFNYPNEFFTCVQTFTPGHLPRVSTSKTGAQSVDFQPFDCGAIEELSPPYVGKTCDVKVRAVNFGSAGAPATFDITIRGETVVPSATFSAAVTTSLSGSLPLGSVQYFNENQNFRWIYDLNNDNVLITPVAGRCEFTPPAFNETIDFSYQYQGSPTYHGLDCCTWQVGSRTGVTGTGQAIFYINVDPNNPANQPGDTDVDGIKNLCDNCPSKANGPLLGTCTAGPRTNQSCRSRQECLNFPCSQSQDDTDRNGTGDACPEPGLGVTLAAGLGALAFLARRRTGVGAGRRRIG